MYVLPYTLHTDNKPKKKAKNQREQKETHLPQSYPINRNQKQIDPLLSIWWWRWFKGTWAHLFWSSNCCSMHTPACCHRIQEAHTGTSCSTFGRRTCRACGTASGSTFYRMHLGTLCTHQAPQPQTITINATKSKGRDHLSSYDTRLLS